MHLVERIKTFFFLVLDVYEKCETESPESIQITLIFNFKLKLMKCHIHEPTQDEIVSNAFLI